MWARGLEFILAIWLAAAAALLSDEPMHAAIALTGTAALMTALFAAISFRTRRRVHLAQLPIGLVLLGHAFLAAASPPPPLLQNNVICGILLILLGVVPNRAASPPAAWRHAFREAS